MITGGPNGGDSHRARKAQVREAHDIIVKEVLDVEAMEDTPLSRERIHSKDVSPKILGGGHTFNLQCYFGKATLNAFQVVISTYYMKIKFPIAGGVREVQWDPLQSCKYYVEVIRKEQKRNTDEGCREVPPSKQGKDAEWMKEAEEEAFLSSEPSQRRASSPLVSSLLLVPFATSWYLKRKGNTLDLNKACYKDFYPLPRIDQLVDSTSSGEGIVITSPNGEDLEFAVKFGLKISNNEVEYQTLAIDMKLAHEVKVTNRILVQGIKRRLERVGGNWMEELTSVLWAYRTTPRGYTGENPVTLVYGTEAP
ncbi:UNVERIFIED_CONTAM: hypothetical protein Scaly_0257600 [Sesamum calycinum]|uniref:Uncharacterized protein n=1 Tax=Sesamum calycinum TaxID=2727403 RepID=A0AAW2S8Z0_9LAMI